MTDVRGTRARTASDTRQRGNGMRVGSCDMDRVMYIQPQPTPTHRLRLPPPLSPRRGSAGAEIKVASARNLELPDSVCWKHTVGQKIASHASPVARSFVDKFYLPGSLDFIAFDYL